MAHIGFIWRLGHKREYRGVFIIRLAGVQRMSGVGHGQIGVVDLGNMTVLQWEERFF